MKKKQLNEGLILWVIVSLLTIGMVETAWAEERNTELTSEDMSEDIEESIVIEIEGRGSITIANDAKLDIINSSVTLDGDDESLADIILEAKDGTQYEFLKVGYTDMQDPELIIEGAFAYIDYTRISSGKTRRIGQTGEIDYNEPVELFAVDDVYIRSQADSSSEILGVINRGDAIEVLGETSSHYLVKKGDVEGYTVRKCISEDEQEAIAAVRAEEAAREQIRKEAAAAAAAAAQQGSSNRVTEVSREKFDDCDGSGHGYYIITYSDGSTAIQNY